MPLTSLRTWIEISGHALRHNVESLQRAVGPAVEVMPVLKANAYGHGTAPVLRALRREKKWGLGVAYGEEALVLRHQGYRGRILVLSYWSKAELHDLIEADIDLVVWDAISLQAIQRAGGRPRVHLKIDSGTTRIGFLGSEFPWLKKQLARSSIRLAGIFSHLANSEEASHIRTKNQIDRFTTLKSLLALNSRVVPHLACTAASLRYPEARFGLIRPGLGVYGLWPSKPIQEWTSRKMTRFSLQPALTWYTRFSQIKIVPAHTSIGYGSTFRTRRKTRVGIIPVGYAEGYDRRLSNTGWVMVHGKRARVLGRVCMNLCMVDLNSIPEARVNSTVTLIGAGVGIDQLSTAAGFLNYEFVSRLHPAIPRQLV